MARHDLRALKLQIPLAELVQQHGIELKGKGDEFVGLCPFHAENTPSFTVTPSKGDGGLYYCMGCNVGGDQVAFLENFLQIDVKEAMQRLAAIVGGDAVTAEGTPPRTPASAPKALRKASDWILSEAPGEKPAPSVLRLQREGKWIEHEVVTAWAYRSPDGALFAYDCRIEFEKPDGTRGKDIIPLTWQVNTKTGEERWKQGSLPKPRILYGSELLGKNPDAQVLIVEGCKTADAARRLFAGLAVVVVSWMGGCKAVRHADWSLLKGRKVAIWPDCDSQVDKQTGEFKPYREQAGLGAALEITELLAPYGVDARIVAVPRPGNWPDGYDLADAETEGRGSEWALEFLRTHLKKPDEIRNETPTNAGNPAEVPQAEPQAANEEPTPLDDDRAPPPVEFEEEDDRQPFKFLGWDRIAAYYLPNNSGQIIELTAASHTKNNLIALAPLQFWEHEFPGQKKNSGVDWDTAINALIQKSQAVGIFDPERVRGRGAWWESGKWAVHLGNKVIIDGKPYSLRDAPTNYIYEKSRPFDIEFENPLPSSESVKLAQLCERLRWIKPISGKLLAGWVFLAPICGAIDWRPHIWITGASGSGKSTVMKHVIGRCLKGVCLEVQGDTTEAGIRQSLVHDARPVVFDEFEAERKKAMERTEDVLAMVTRASSESDAQLLKGSGDGKAEGFRTRAMFCFSSVGVNIRQYAAATRVTVLDLATEPETEDSISQYNELLADLFGLLTPEYIRKMQARAVHMIPVIRQNAQTFAEAAAITLGSRRMGDQIGTLLAGVYALHGGKAISREDAIAWINKQNWDDVIESSDGKDEASCLAHILSYQVRVEGGSGTITRTLGDLIQRAAEFGESAADLHVTWDESMGVLKRHGIKVEGGFKDATVSFANKHRELQRVLIGTSWESSYWRTLLRIKGAAKHDPTKYGAITTRGVKLPILSIM